MPGSTADHRRAGDLPAGSAHEAASTPDPRRAVWIRLLVSPLLLAVVLGALMLHDRTGNALPTDLLLLVAGAGAAFELARLLEPGSSRAFAGAAALAAGLMAGVGLLAPQDVVLRMELRVLGPLVLLFALLTATLGDLRAQATPRVALAVLPVLFVGVPLGLVRDLPSGPDLARWLVYVLVVSKSSDMGGWLVGKPFGRHKLVPRISPRKSWEGLAGGLGLSVLAAVLLPGVLGVAGAWSGPRRAAFGLLLGGASVLAGLLHSVLKRRVGAKDSSRLIPEIGGLLDMVDSMVLAGPAAWLWFRAGLG